MAIESYFEDIADAIRERGGTSATLTPAAMPQAILDIPGGGGGGSSYHKDVEPIKQEVGGGYVSMGDWVVDQYTTSKSDVYEVTPGSHYLAHLGSVVGTRFRIALFADDPTNAMQRVTGNSPATDQNNPRTYANMYNSLNEIITVPSGYHYLVFTKTNNTQTGLKSYLVEFNENGFS